MKQQNTISTKGGKYTIMVSEKSNDKDDNTSLPSEKVSSTVPHRTTPYTFSDHARKTSAAEQGTHTNSSTMDIKKGTAEPWMQRFTASTFGKLHTQIIPSFNN